MTGSVCDCFDDLFDYFGYDDDIPTLERAKELFGGFYGDDVVEEAYDKFLFSLSDKVCAVNDVFW